ncbi:MAG TPA: 50S ribosomal protein L6 [Chloroflexia bacterium]|jgi:large subunit ribosomal protein L6|nr:50S ribosomal protein L6 [Chloroflexia bacterium]
MSRIGNKPIPLPKAVKVELNGSHLKVQGPKGTLEQTFRPEIGIEVQEAQIVVTRPAEDKLHRSLHGLTRTLISNMVVGVTDGFTRQLEIAGVGYRVAKEGQALVFALGFSHPVRIEPPTGVSFAVETPTRFSVQGIDKQVVGQQAAQIRSLREPEPYKGKGITYQGERIRRKAGKAGKVGGKK